MSEGKQSDEFIFYGFIPGTLIDYPGCVAATVFTIGCNFRCPYCQNRDLVLSQTESLPEHPVGAILDRIAPDRSWTDGICITGGEPLLSTGIEGALRKFKEAGLRVKLDTNGSLPKRLLRLIRDGLLDYVAMDVKAPLTEREYSKAIGLPAGARLPAVRESIDLLKESRGHRPTGPGHRALREVFPAAVPAPRHARPGVRGRPRARTPGDGGYARGGKAIHFGGRDPLGCGKRSGKTYIGTMNIPMMALPFTGVIRKTFKAVGREEHEMLRKILGRTDRP